MLTTGRCTAVAGLLIAAGSGHGQPCVSFWSDQFQRRDLDDTVYCLTVFDDGSGPALYAGGFFTKAGEVALNHVAKLEGDAWSAVGSGTDQVVFRMAACTECPDGAPSLYASGIFHVAGGVAVNGVARWDGRAWSALGSLEDGDGFGAMAVLDDGSGPRLYAHRFFTKAGGEPGESISRWDGASWTSLGDGLNGSIGSLVLFDDGTGTTLYAGGWFYEDGKNVGQVARWDGTSWTMIAGALDGPVKALAAWDDGTGLALYAGGDFTAAGGVPARGLAKWDGAAWSALPSPLDGAVAALAVFDDGSGAGPALYATGTFMHAGGLAANYVARWDGRTWTALSAGLISAGKALAVLDGGEDGSSLLFVGGGFSLAGLTHAVGVAWWDGSAWSGAADPGIWGLDEDVFDLEEFDDGSGPALYVAGDFDTAGGVASRDIARFDGRQWSSLAGGTGGYAKIYSLETFDDGHGAALYAGGGFDTVGGVEAQSIVRWDGRTWSPLGWGIHGGVRDMTVFDDGNGPALYVGGGFDKAGEIGANNVARWDGSAWSPLGDGTEGFVYALAVFDDGSGPAVYAAGKYYEGGKSEIFLVRWDGKSWSDVGGVDKDPNSGEYATLYDLAACDAGGIPALYVAGYFDSIGGFPERGIARWNGSTWLSAGGGIGSGAVTALRVVRLGSDRMPALYAGGEFNVVGGTDAKSVARWNGAFWSGLGEGMDGYGYLNAIGSFDDGSGSGPSLFVGGTFWSINGTNPPSIAQWVGCPVDDPPPYRPCRYEAALIQAPVDPFYGPPPVYALGLNSAGDVVGDWGVSDRAFVWTPLDGFMNLEGMPYGSSSARDINDARQIVGVSHTHSDWVGFRYQDGQVQLLPPPLPGGASGATAINASGEIAGWRSTGGAQEPYNAFVWSPQGGFIDLGVMNGPNSACSDINDLGDAVGWTGTNGGETEAFLRHKGRLTLLGPVPGGTTSSAAAINNLGQIAVNGKVQLDGESVYRAFLLDAGQWTDLGVLPGFERAAVYDVNDSGVAVGRCWHPYPNNADEPFVWQAGVMTPISDLVPWDTGVGMYDVAAVSGAGQIVGDSLRLTPVARRPADINGDCDIDASDLLILLFEWGKAGSPADLDGDGSVGVRDLLMLLATWT